MINETLQHRGKSGKNVENLQKHNAKVRRLSFAEKILDDMKRPTLCNTTAALDDCYTASETDIVAKKKDSRLSRMRQALSSTLLPGRRGRVFGVRLGELPVGKDGVPNVVSRLCGFIEFHGFHCGGIFRLSCGNQKLVEHLKLSFDRTGDADLESVADVASVATLLKLWIRELPEPIILSDVATKLLQIQENNLENSKEWHEAVCHAIMTLPESNIRLLCYLLRFLNNYNQHSPHPKCHHRMSGGGGVAAVFSTLLILQAIQWKRTIRSIHNLRLANQFMSILISETNNICKEIFGSYSLTHHEVRCIQYRCSGDGAASQPDDGLAGARAAGLVMHSSQRKRKECQEPLSMGTHERKVIRSNSEERPNEGGASSRDIRRVSSHEDFAIVKGSTLRNMNKHEPLHEHNTNVPEPMGHAVHKATAENNLWEEITDDEHERRRSTERFARSVVRRGRRNASRTQRVFNSKMTLQGKEESSSKEQENSLSPSPTPCFPPLDLGILHQQVDCAEPLTSQGSWSNQSEYHHSPRRCEDVYIEAGMSAERCKASRSAEDCSEEEQIVNSEVMLSPRNSVILTRRVALDPNIPPSPPQEHVSPLPVNGIFAAQTRMKHLSKQMTNVKKKLKRYEEEFEKKRDCKLSLLVKMDNNEVKKLYAEMNKLHKEMAVLKDENELSLMETSSKHVQPRGLNTCHLKHSRIENLVHDVQKYLKDKRDGAGRPESLRDMSLEQMREEKINMQKALVSLENMVGRAESPEHRLVVRPLYDRYRMLKQLIVRIEQLKLKDSVPELETIHEHEAMAFTLQPTSSEQPQVQEVIEEQPLTLPDLAASPAKREHFVLQADDADNETLWNNLHTLPLSELLDQQRNTHEEKRALRRLLREQEQQLLQQGGKKLINEVVSTVDNTRNLYKKAKCKLRLLDALVSKQSQL